jgi:tellurite resistance protein
MPSRTIQKRPNRTKAAGAATRLDVHEDQLLDALTSAGAIIACADGWIERAERNALADFVQSNGSLPALTRAEILDALDRRLRRLATRGGVEAALDRIGRYAGRAPARLVIDASRRVAEADGALDAREIHFLQRIHIALGAPSTRERALGAR